MPIQQVLYALSRSCENGDVSCPLLFFVTEPSSYGGWGGGKSLCVPSPWGTLCVTLGLAWGDFRVQIGTSLVLPVGLCKSWWVVLSAEWMMKSVKVGVVGVSVLLSLLLADIQCSEVSVHPAQVQVLVSGCGAIGPWGCSGLYFKLIIFVVQLSMVSVLPWGGFSSAPQVLWWRPQEISAVS